MTREELLVIKNRLANTTPGAWEIDESTDDRRYVTDVWIDGEDNGLIEIHRLGEAQKYNDAEFIGYAKQDMATLINELERYRAALVKIAYTPKFETLADVEAFADEVLEKDTAAYIKGKC